MWKAGQEELRRDEPKFYLEPAVLSTAVDRSSGTGHVPGGRWIGYNFRLFAIRISDPGAPQ
jgi:hypothetical protein